MIVVVGRVIFVTASSGVGGQLSCSLQSNATYVAAGLGRVAPSSKVVAGRERLRGERFALAAQLGSSAVAHISMPKIAGNRQRGFGARLPQDSAVARREVFCAQAARASCLANRSIFFSLLYLFSLFYPGGLCTPGV
ncbi:MAG: hypothetical protein RSA94_05815, partial [Mucinivorans sp.]